MKKTISVLLFLFCIFFSAITGYGSSNYTPEIFFKNTIAFQGSTSKLDFDMRETPAGTSKYFSLGADDRLYTYVYPFSQNGFFIGPDFFAYRDDNFSQGLGQDLKIGNGNYKNPSFSLSMGYIYIYKNLVIEKEKNRYGTVNINLGEQDNFHLNFNVIYDLSQVAYYNFFHKFETEIVVGLKEIMPVFFKISVQYKSSIKYDSADEYKSYRFFSNHFNYGIQYYGNTHDISLGMAYYKEKFAIYNDRYYYFFRDEFSKKRIFRGINGSYKYRGTASPIFGDISIMSGDKPFFAVLKIGSECYF